MTPPPTTLAATVTATSRRLGAFPISTRALPAATSTAPRMFSVQPHRSRARPTAIRWPSSPRGGPHTSCPTTTIKAPSPMKNNPSCSSTSDATASIILVEARSAPFGTSAFYLRLETRSCQILRMRPSRPAPSRPRQHSSTLPAGTLRWHRRAWLSKATARSRSTAQPQFGASRPCGA